MDSLEERMNKADVRYLSLKTQIQGMARAECVDNLASRLRMTEILTENNVNSIADHAVRIEKLERSATIISS